ncbi:MAG: electron transfer flavoprotein subunit alpha/FixB family protein [Dehalococcoidia bacterium]|nr:electron transfer flavoprotein subunit alpha/FixB family protein [Dehalococcoidia bacterium]
MQGILVLGELDQRGLAGVTGELLSLARSLADETGGEVSVSLQGASVGSEADEAIAMGADTAYKVESPLLSEPQIDAHLSALEQVARQIEPSIILVGRTPLGRDVGPRLAFRLGAAVAQDCVEVSVNSDTGKVKATRPVYGGNAMASVSFTGDGAQVVIVRPKTIEPNEPDSARAGSVEEFSAELDESVIRARLVETVSQETEGVRLEDAGIVVSGGRGLGGPEPFEQLQTLSDLLGGARGASRAACDAGWIDHSHQVGLTGKTITPDLYITIGISGASQHMAGCSASKNIVAINRDEDANIFKSATYGVVGDWNKVLPSFMETLRELRDD